MSRIRLARLAWGNGDIREEGLSVLLEVRLVGVEHTVEPWQELLGTVVGVENDGAESRSANKKERKSFEFRKIRRKSGTYTP